MENSTLDKDQMIENATRVLDNLLKLYRKAQDNLEANKGTMGEALAYDFGMQVYYKYEATKQAYAAIGLTDLGIHNNKVGA